MWMQYGHILGALGDEDAIFRVGHYHCITLYVARVMKLMRTESIKKTISEMILMMAQFIVAFETPILMSDLGGPKIWCVGQESATL